MKTVNFKWALLPITISIVTVGVTGVNLNLLAPAEEPPRTPSDDQLFNWAANNSYQSPSTATTLHGIPVPSLSSSLTVGDRGEILMQDHFFMEKLASFVRERIPERTVHAKGTGAHGYFEVTHDVSQFTKAKFLNGIGKKTPVFSRFSTCAGGRDSSDTVVDVKAFATKFYTEEGNNDILCINTEAFPLIDPMQFPDLLHTLKKNPVTGQVDLNMFWDFISLKPEAVNFILDLFSDRGRSDGYRRMDWFAVNVFKFVNATGGVFFGKFHWRTNLQKKALTFQESEILAGSDPNYNTQDLYDAIARKDFPSWNLYIQIRTQEDIQSSRRVNPFDLTKIWRREEYPLIQVGRLVLNRNPVNQHAEVEQAAFAPSNLVPGIAPSQDRILGGRIFAYTDAQRYRLGGPNFAHLPINRPLPPVNTYVRDGPGNFGENGNGAPNYYPNSFGGPEPNPGAANIPRFITGGIVDRYDFNYENNDIFEQPRLFLERDIGPEERVHMVESLADNLLNARADIRERVLKNNFYPVSKVFGDEVRAAIEYALRNNWRQTCRREVASQWQRPQQQQQREVPLRDPVSTAWEDWHNFIPNYNGKK